MRFKLEFNCETSAFDDDPRLEILRILRDLALRIYDAESTSGNIQDYNGNTIGKFRLIGKETRP